MIRRSDEELLATEVRQVERLIILSILRTERKLDFVEDLHWTAARNWLLQNTPRCEEVRA